MQNIVNAKKYRFIKCPVIGLLVIAHIMLTVPISEVCAMESASFKVDEKTVSSGSGDSIGAGERIPYSNIAESAVENIESANYKASLGYIDTVASNPPICKALIPDINMRIVWSKGQTCSTTIALDNYFISPDNSSLTYQVEGASHISVVINPSSHIASFSQDPNFSGSEAIRFVAVDSNGNKTKSNFIMLIVKSSGNNPPVIYPINDITVKENDLAQVTPVVFDPDGDAITMTYSSPFDDGGKWQTTYNDAGTYKVTATASDGTSKASAVFNVIVKNVNRPPIIDPIPDITVGEGDFVKINVVAHDPDGDNATVSYPVPFDVNGGWQTVHKDAGVYHFIITASDGDLSTTRDVNVTVTNVNISPVIKLYADETSPAVNEEFTVYVLAQDPNGDSLKLTLKIDGNVISGCDNILLDSQTFSTNLSIANAGSHTISAVVTEANISGSQNTASASLKINVDENSSQDSYFPISGDFNGDGLTDLGYFNKALGIWKVQLAKADGSFAPVEYWTPNDFGNNDGYCYPMTSDFNGDGRTDAAFVRVPTSDGAKAYIRVALSSATAFDIPTADWRSTSAGNLNSDWHYAIFTGDFNGDGITDVGQIRVDSNTSLYIGLTNADLSPANMDNWVKDGSHVSISDFSPIAADFNGDGLTDLCLFNKTSGRWAATLSKGDRFGDTTDWLTNFSVSKDPVLGDFNCDGLTDIGYMEEGDDGYWVLKYAVSDGAKFNLDSSGQPYVYQTTIPNYIKGTFMSGDFNGDSLFDIAVFDKSTHEWTVSLHHSKSPDLLVSIDNGMGGTTAIAYANSSAYENNGADGLPTLPFTIRVVSSVTQSDGVGSSYTATYFYRDGFFDTTQREFRGFGYVKVIDAEESYKETYFKQDSIYKGRPAREVVRDRYDRVYSDTVYNWQDRKLFNDTVDWPYLLDKTSTAYDPVTAANKSVKTTFTYDDYGNATNVRNEGFLDVTGDEQETCATYYYDTVNWILAKPIESTVKNATGTIVSATRCDYYPNGSVKKEERWLGQVGTTPLWGSADNPTTEFTYDAAGNVETVKDARGNITTTVYDTTKTFPASVQNVLGHTQTFTHDKATGKILTSTDPNNQITTSEYDGFGRTRHVVGPGGISEVTYTYNMTASPVLIMSSTKVSDGKYMKAFSFIDGLGRRILSRTEAEYQSVARHIVSGEVQYDSRGQVVKKYLPYYINVPSPDDIYLPPVNKTPYVSYEYDAMGRPVKTIRPDKKSSCTIYGVNTTEAVNENGQHGWQTRDAYGRIVEVREDIGSVTNYVYDALGNLTDTYDSASPRNRVHMEYDTLGRKILMTDPDMGGFAGKSWRYYYDKVGNLISQVDAKSQTITFQYDAINRLQYKSTGVTYVYDDNTKPNYIGRLSRVIDPSGTTEFFYDILGREVKTVKTITTASYTIERTYDSLDRIIAVKYPDNSTVTYTYNRQGGIDKIGAVPAGDCPYFVSSVNYNANGQIEHIVYGNGTSTDYAYDPSTFRLDELTTSDPHHAVVQNLSYNFDPVGNVIAIQDSINTNTQSFRYDTLNRLISANGESYGAVNYQYDSIGNLRIKGNLEMGHGQGAGPHAVTTLRRGISSSAPGEGELVTDLDGNGQSDRVVYGGSQGGIWVYFNNSTWQQLHNISPKSVIAADLDGNGKHDLVVDFGPQYGIWIYYNNSTWQQLHTVSAESIAASDLDGNGKDDLVVDFGPQYGVWTYFNNSTWQNTGSPIGITLSYDENGNMITKGNNAFEYDQENRLTTAHTQKGGGPFTLTLNLTTGWNLFSIPGTVPNANGVIKDVLQSIDGKYDQVSTYDAAAGKWLHYVNDPKFNQFDKFEVGKGYLIYVKEPCTLTINGSFPLTNQTDQLKAGWNLVAAPTDSTIEPAHAFQGVAYDSLAEYNGTTYVYNPTTLQKGKAYWIYVSSDQTWSVPVSQIDTKYTYDGDGGRVLRQEDKELTVYIGSSYELQGPAGKTAEKTTKHIYMGSTKVCSVETTVGTTHTYYYHQDHIGSSNVITDETGAVVNILEYTPYGEVSRNTGNYSTDKRFTGKICDESSALYYYGARYYDPELGRFITADPTIQHPYDPQDLNRYAYCRNNPVTYIDPTGYGFWEWLISLFAGFVGGIVTVMSGGNFILGAACAGAVYGGITGAMAGGLEGALKGALTGFVMGGALAFGGSLAYIGPLIAGGAIAYGGYQAYKSGKWAGLADYAITLGAGMAGFYAGSVMATSGASSSAGGEQAGSAESENVAKAKVSLDANQKARAVKIYDQGESGPVLKGAMYDGKFYPAKIANGGEKVFRIYGGKSLQRGDSWTPVDPFNTPNFSDLMGLPEGNTRGALIGGRLVPGSRYVELSASPIGSNRGGGIEFILDNANRDVSMELLTTWDFTHR